MLSFVIAEEDLRIETSYPFNKVTVVFLLDNYRFSYTYIYIYIYIYTHEHEAIQQPISENNIGAPLVPQKAHLAQFGYNNCMCDALWEWYIRLE